jgi:hypothetical protein
MIKQLKIGLPVLPRSFKLKDAFVLDESELGQVFEKTNGSNAIVQGITIELRANFNRNFS